MLVVGLMMAAGIAVSAFFDKDMPKGPAPKRPINNSTTKNIASAVLQALS